MTETEAKAKLSELGVYAAWYLRPSQMDIYEFLRAEKDPFIEASRRFGKTTSILAFVMELLRANPGWICRWCEPWQKQARQIVMPIMAKLQRHTPKELRFKWQSTDTCYKMPNESTLYLVGVNDDRGESARGAASNIIVADEYGIWVDAAYITTDVLRPQLLGQEGQWFIKTSTPPRNLGHPYYKEKEQAIRDGRYLKKILYDNESLSEIELAKIIRDAGGLDSTSFKREYLCEEVSDPTLVIIPEWHDVENTVPDDYPRPEFFTPYVGGDSGADDNTAILFGYYDWNTAETIIEEELVLNGRTTREIVARAQEIEARLWGEKKPKLRVYDAPKQIIYDIFTDHKWPVQMPQKDDKLAAIHQLRTQVQARKFKVKERCKILRRQLKVGTWRDEKHLDFHRETEDQELAHLDAIAAAIYFNRHVDKRLNPTPHNHGLSRYTHFIPANSPSPPQDSTESALASLFGAKPRGR